MPEDYVELKESAILPRLPLEGFIDLTYRCNNDCLHCWVRIPENAPEQTRELTLAEIKHMVNQARAMGCRKLSFSGGEPMLRPDFIEIIDYITANALTYSLNTNGTLITPKIARLLKRKGNKMISLYGATADVHDRITRRAGSFQATMRGFAYLKEARAGFVVQIVPLRDNYHQFEAMVQLAQDLSRAWRLGALFLYLSACGCQEMNERIARQRLSPRRIIELDKPDVSYQELMRKWEIGCETALARSDDLFSFCTAMPNFHIDPYGQACFCRFLKDPAFFYDLKRGSFREFWENFTPSLAEKFRGTAEYLNHCGSCRLRGDCHWCPAKSYLEHRNLTTRIQYLCQLAEEHRKFNANWRKEHRRYYKIGDIVIQVESELPIQDSTFRHKFRLFEVAHPGKYGIAIRHHFLLPELDGRRLGQEIYRRPPWAIYRKGNSWVYLGYAKPGGSVINKIGVFNQDHTRASIYSPEKEDFLKGDLHSLTLFPTDQILLARVLADRQGCYLHSCGVNLEGQGLLFMGHSGAGKTTMGNLLKGKAEILCDDRIIVRRFNRGYKIYGTWSHGELEEVSATSAPLKAILFLEKADENKAIPLDNKKEITRRLLACVVRPLVTAEWWEKTLSLVDKINKEIPCYILRFQKDVSVIDTLRQI